MNYIEFLLRVGRPHADAAEAAAIAVCEGGLYVEDYADLEEDVRRIAHVDLIEPELREKPRDEVIFHLYAAPREGAAFGRALRTRLLAAGVSAYTLRRQTVKAEDWENSWKQYYHPIEIGTRLAVAPSWEPYDNPARTVLRLDPGMAFGTGAHETTALCLEALDSLVRGGERVLDIGCGSGILGIAALLLGAGSALGVDIDAAAVRTAAENAARNGVQQRYAALAGDLARQATGRYHIITANIVADAILRLSPAVPPLLAPGGIFIASGILAGRRQEVTDGLRKAGLRVTQAPEQNGWAALWCEGAPAPQKGE